MGIGHTRWATHGAPSFLNSHPHLNEKGTIAVVHNGIIENYIELREWLIERGYKFVSDTDTEVVPHLIDFYYEGDIVDASIKAVKRLQGSYALGIVSIYELDDILYTWAGPEIAVASIKAYTTQLIAMYIIALYFAQNKNTLTSEEIEAIKNVY